LGEQAVKNIAEPVRVLRVRGEIESAAPTNPVGAGLALPGKGAASSAPTWYRRTSVLVMTGLLLITGAVVTVWYLSFPTLHIPHSEFRTQEALPLPDKPSIVVLPFVNMSKDSDQEYFSDGITEDLTTALSQLSSLFVIARNSAFTYKGKA